MKERDYIVKYITELLLQQTCIPSTSQINVNIEHEPAKNTTSNKQVYRSIVKCYQISTHMVINGYQDIYYIIELLLQQTCMADCYKRSYVIDSCLWIHKQLRNNLISNTETLYV